MHYSPPDSAHDLEVTEPRGWRLAILTDGQAIKDLSQEEFKMVSTAELKMQLTKKLDRLKLQQAQQSKSLDPKKKAQPTQTETYIKEPYPAGVKFHMFKEQVEDQEAKRKSYWHQIYKLCSKQQGAADSRSNPIRDVMRSHYKLQRYLARVEEKFTHGEPIVRQDYDDVHHEDDDTDYYRNYRNFTEATNQQMRNATANQGQRTRFSNLRSTTNASRMNTGSGPNAQSGGGSRYFYNAAVSSADDELRAASMDPQRLKITNARDLMEHIVEQNARKTSQLKQLKARQAFQREQFLKARMSKELPAEAVVDLKVPASNHRAPPKRASAASSSVMLSDPRAPRQSRPSGEIKQTPFKSKDELATETLDSLCDKVDTLHSSRGVGKDGEAILAASEVSVPVISLNKLTSVASQDDNF